MQPHSQRNLCASDFCIYSLINGFLAFYLTCVDANRHWRPTSIVTLFSLLLGNSRRGHSSNNWPWMQNRNDSDVIFNWNLNTTCAHRIVCREIMTRQCLAPKKWFKTVQFYRLRNIRRDLTLGRVIEQGSQISIRSALYETDRLLFVDWNSLIGARSARLCFSISFASVVLPSTKICHSSYSLRQKHVYLGWTQRNCSENGNCSFRAHLSLDTATTISIRTHYCRRPHQILSSSVCRSPASCYRPPFWQCVSDCVNPNAAHQTPTRNSISN